MDEDIMDLADEGEEKETEGEEEELEEDEDEIPGLVEEEEERT